MNNTPFKPTLTLDDVKHTLVIGPSRMGMTIYANVLNKNAGSLTASGSTTCLSNKGDSVNDLIPSKQKKSVPTPWYRVFERKVGAKGLTSEQHHD